ncbi:MAG: hypothetical protein OEY03_05240 [Rhizobacter sp.]|nr:hypothetical protein [Rhizobacter sp.]
MKGLPIELLFVLFFVGMMLFNVFKQRAAARRPPEATQDEPDPDEIPESVWGRGTQDPTSLTDAAAPTPASRRVAAPAASVAPAVRRRRFDRQALLGSRRRVQDAFVVATILGRCRADEPHEER